MHASLTRKANRTLIAIFSVGAAVLAIAIGEAVYPACLVGSAFGMVAGVLQRRVLRSHLAEFIQTTTAMDVRRVMRSSKTGAAATSLTWVTGGTLFLVQAFGSGQIGPMFPAWIAGFLSFMSLRDLVAYGALPAVARTSSPEGGKVPNDFW